MTRTMVIEFSIRESNDAEPIMTGTRRVPWPQETSVEEMAEQLVREACRELHRPKVEWRTV